MTVHVNASTSTHNYAPVKPIYAKEGEKRTAEHKIYTASCPLRNAKVAWSPVVVTERQLVNGCVICMQQESTKCIHGVIEENLGCNFTSQIIISLHLDQCENFMILITYDEMEIWTKFRLRTWWPRLKPYMQDLLEGSRGLLTKGRLSDCLSDRPMKCSSGVQQFLIHRNRTEEGRKEGRSKSHLTWKWVIKVGLWKDCKLQMHSTPYSGWLQFHILRWKRRYLELCH